MRVIRGVARRAIAAIGRPTPPPLLLPTLNHTPELLQRGLEAYVSALPNRIELAQQINLLESGDAVNSPHCIATAAYLHTLLGDYDLASKRLARLGPEKLAQIIPNAERTWLAFLHLMFEAGEYDDAVAFLDALVRRSDAHFEAIHPTRSALAVQRSAVERGVPAVFLSTTPKSGTVFLRSKLAEILNAPIFQISLSGFKEDRVIPEVARRFSLGGAVAVQHTPATPNNLRILREAGVRKVLIHVRDPRQCVTSLLMSSMHIWNPDNSIPASGLNLSEIKPPPGYKGMSIDQQRAYVSRIYAPIYCRWTEGWIAASEYTDLPKIKIATYDEFVNNKKQYFRGLCEFFDLDPPTVLPALLAAEPKKGVMHYRNGEFDEWRRVLPKAAQEEFWSHMSPKLAGAFGWRP